MMKMNNKTLLIVLVALAAVWGIYKIIDSKRGERTFKKDVISIDTGDIHTILLYPKANGHQEIKLAKTSSDEWQLSFDGKNMEADLSSVNQVITNLLSIKPFRLAAKKKDKWTKYEVTDSLGTRVKALNKSGEVIADLYVGKFSVKQRQAPQGMQFQQNNNITGISYIRMNGEDEVYASEGFLTMAFNQEAKSFRNKLVTKFNKDDITSIVLSYPADSGFSINKVDSIWMIDSKPIDEKLLTGYLNGLSNITNNSFDDNFQETASPVYVVTINGNNMPPISIKAYAGLSENELILHSSQNPKAYFKTDKKGIFNKIFIPRSKLVPNEEVLEM